jgi:hypothetical protein
MHLKTLQPTTVNEYSFLQVVANKADELTIKVFDVRGRMAKTINTTINQGMQQLNLNMTDLDTGNYVLNAFSGGNFLKSFKFVKQ